MPRTPSSLDGPEALSRFSAWARRVVDHIRDDRRLSVRAIAREANVARSIIYRWIDGEITKPPEQETVQRFCDNLGVPRAEPFAIFGWSVDGPAEPEAVPLPTIEDDDLVAVQKILKRHNLSDDEILEVRAVLRMVRNRFEEPEDSQDDNRAAS